MKTLKRFVVLAVAAPMFGMGVAWAHGEPAARHGGILTLTEQLAFELVVKVDRIDLYTYDDDHPVSSERMSGMLTIVNDDGKLEAKLTAAGSNLLRAAKVSASSGSRVIAIVTMPDGNSLAVQFVVP